jgi:TROVE domain
MDSYIRYKGARCRIFVHSRSENPETWEERPSKKNNKAIIWTCLIPGYSLDKQNNNNIQRIIEQIRSTSTN